MAPTVYLDLLSAPVQAVALTIRKAGLESVVQSKIISLAAGDHMKPEFVEKFPIHAVPALEDDGLFLTDSHAICAYLVSAYAKNDSLYPKDVKKRAKVDQFLHFSNSILYNRLRDMSEPLWMKQRKDVPEEKKQRVRDALQLLQDMLGDKKWLCGDQFTLADLCCVCEINACRAMCGEVHTEFKTLSAWFDRCQAELPGFEEIALKGLATYKAVLAHFMA